MVKKPNNWTFYVYQFFYKTECVYVGKGSGKRFCEQQRRFKEFDGQIIAYFKTEDDALVHEEYLIKNLAPIHNKIHNKGNQKPWKLSLVPDSTRETAVWIEALGTKEVCARLLLAKPWSILKKYNVDIKGLLSTVENYEGVYYGLRC